MRRLLFGASLFVLGCSDGGNGRVGIDLGAPSPQQCNGSTATTSTTGMTPVTAPGLSPPSGFVMETVAAVGSARELAALPNGDLLVATGDNDVWLVPDAEADGAAGKPVKFASISDAPVQGVAFAAATCTVYIASQHGALRRRLPGRPHRRRDHQDRQRAHRRRGPQQRRRHPHDLVGGRGRRQGLRRRRLVLQRVHRDRPDARHDPSSSTPTAAT